MNAILKALKSKTVWGSIILAGAGVAAAPAITPIVIAKAVGAVVLTAGGRDALDKAAQVVAAAQNPNG